ncbi:purine-nucleoside phosphorylase [Candidatus Legionella polyplacis]|uniref:Purine nucleoside phosphorylase n=1 Tax=Candidatus Legionella polyplacis TaxID=2005262 RepID=A0ABZ2GXG8_9GAMM
MQKKKITLAHISTKKIKKKNPYFKPIIGIILGSGLGNLSSMLNNTIIIKYKDLPGFPKCTVNGHNGNLILGNISGKDVVCLQGRSHSYEGTNFHTMKTYVRTLKLLGCQYFLCTNASGSLKKKIKPGEIMILTDHINMQPNNPLVGINDEEFGPRFLPLNNLYDAKLKEKMLIIAKKENIILHQGVYISVLGPNYETAAEIKAFKILGGDAVGMSTIPEVLLAKHCGMKIIAIAGITNYATGIVSTNHTHETVLAMASKIEKKLNKLIKKFIEELLH